MKIVMRSGKKEHWQVVDPVSAKAEAELQELLLDSPSPVPIDEIRDGVTPLVVATREFGLPGSGRTDLLAFTADGDIAVIECKLAANPESKRTFIGQIHKYASYLWGMDYQKLDRRFPTKSKDRLPPRRQISEFLEPRPCAGKGRRLVLMRQVPRPAHAR